MASAIADHDAYIHPIDEISRGLDGIGKTCRRAFTAEEPATVGESPGWNQTHRAGSTDQGNIVTGTTGIVDAEFLRADIQKIVFEKSIERAANRIPAIVGYNRERVARRHAG